MPIAARALTHGLRNALDSRAGGSRNSTALSLLESRRHIRDRRRCRIAAHIGVHTGRRIEARHLRRPLPGTKEAIERLHEAVGALPLLDAAGQARPRPGESAANAGNNTGITRLKSGSKVSARLPMIGLTRQRPCGLVLAGRREVGQAELLCHRIPSRAKELIAAGSRGGLAGIRTGADRDGLIGVMAVVREPAAPVHDIVAGAFRAGDRVEERLLVRRHVTA